MKDIQRENPKIKIKEVQWKDTRISSGEIAHDKWARQYCAQTAANLLLLTTEDVPDLNFPTFFVLCILFFTVLVLYCL